MSIPPYRSARWLTRLAQGASLLMGPMVVGYWIVLTRLLDGDINRADLVGFAPLIVLTVLGLWGIGLTWMRRVQNNVLALGGQLKDTRIWILFVRGTPTRSSFQQRLMEIFAQCALGDGVEEGALLREANIRLRTAQILFGASVFVMMGGLVAAQFVPDAISLPYLGVAVASLLCLVSTFLVSRFVGEIHERLDEKAARLDANGEWARTLSSPSEIPVPGSTARNAVPMPTER